MKKKICLAQIGFTADIKQHIEKIKTIISEHRKADLIVFPELILHGHPSVEKPEGLLYRRVKYFYKSVASDADDMYRYIQRKKARVIIGELKGGPGRFFNVATYIDQEQIDHYRKTHVHWTENFKAGRDLMVFDTAAGKIGPMICFDSAFSETWRVITLKGADIIVVISATPASFNPEYIWKRLIGGASFNQVFVVYVNRPGSFFSGHSAVIDPQGNVLVDAGKREAVIECQIDLEKMRNWRTEENIFDHRRPLLYRDISRRHKVGILSPQSENE
jgi:predicted amidohydrolase